MNALLAVNAYFVNEIIIQNENVLRRTLRVKRLHEENRLLNLPNSKFRTTFRVSKKIFMSAWEPLYTRKTLEKSYLKKVESILHSRKVSLSHITNRFLFLIQSFVSKTIHLQMRILLKISGDGTPFDTIGLE